MSATRKLAHAIAYYPRAFRLVFMNAQVAIQFKLPKIYSFWYTLRANLPKRCYFSVIGGMFLPEAEHRRMTEFQQSCAQK